MSAPEQPDAEQRAEALRLARAWVDEAKPEDVADIFPIARALLAAEAEVARLAELNSGLTRDFNAMLVSNSRAEAELAELREERDKAGVALWRDRGDWLDTQTRAERAEARVKRLEEALREIAEHYEPNTATACNEIARRALSEPTEGE